MPPGLPATLSATILAVIICVGLHYEGLRALSDRLPVPHDHHRRRIVLLIVCLLALHIIEIWVFGTAYYILLSYGEAGELIGVANITIFDCVYYSAAVFTTLGFGDIVPVGAIRLMTGTEAVSGLTLITWSASFTFLEMLKTWKRTDD